MADRERMGSAVSNSGKDGDRAKENHHVVSHSRKTSSPRHYKETHGTSNDIDEKTPVNEVKGPSILQRAKEEIEALAETIVHPKK
ncbi:uncharacterized protein LOC127266236 [Andrographis paniculata]|uniref:uncharacterized protein LOC127266236 n=1 Tax=Andrographis paniculata TaxID=175694 RepID=UPI0021E86E82|nr:uncharacterized protein LOC127266236 [Andrographis paniculata]